MSWGDAFTQAAAAALSSVEAAGAAVADAAARARDAAAAAARLAQQAAARGASAVVRGARATAEAAVQGAQAVRDGAIAVGRGATNVAVFGARAVGETAVATGRGAAQLADAAIAGDPLIGAPYRAVREMLSPTEPPRARVNEPCPNSIEAKRQRLEQRQALIANASEPGATPSQRAAAQRLARHNEAVELARLSEDAYKQYGKPPVNQPPLGWTRVDDPRLAPLLAKSKAVIYQTPKDWPGGQKTVLAFRGTVPSEADDLTTNFDQAMGLNPIQYQAASGLGEEVSRKYGEDTLVTGHSLGGGKAQAAGASGGLRGTMFNSAGLHPDTVGGAMPEATQFTQYRSPFDPLTGIQNSAALQTGVGTLAGALAMPLGTGLTAGTFLAEQLGLPTLPDNVADAARKAAVAFPKAMGNLVTQGNLLPPAVGPVVQVPSLDDRGRPVAPTDAMGQHSVHGVINGIEREKEEDVATLRGGRP